MRLTFIFAILYFVVLGVLMWQESRILTNNLVIENAEITRNFVLEMEFLEENSDVKSFFESFGNAASQAVEILKTATYADFLFILIFPFFFFLFGKYFCGFNAREMWFASLFTLTMQITDVGENSQLLNILDNFDGDDFSKFLPQLKMFTWLKWSAVSLIFVMYARRFFQSKSRFLKISGGVFVLSFLIGITAFFGGISPVIYGQTTGLCGFIIVYISIREYLKPGYFTGE